ncbi:MAG: radical SAM family heme chaperone HemW [Myxococcota bacterium]
MTFGVYVHVPWCRARCPYCHFDILPQAGRPDADPFVARVVAEAKARLALAPGPPATIFFGGGTPSRIDGTAFATMIEALAPASDAEITAEANPEDIDDAWLAEVIDAGINRISLGVQSFIPEVARRLGRGHTSPQAEAAIQRIAQAGLRTWSIDLIFAVPGQSAQMFRDDLRRVTTLGVPHVSLYGLTIEPETSFARAVARGRLMPVDDETWRQMFDDAAEWLGGAGYERYEVSTFAKPGHRCAHNQLYWTNRPYVGLGPGAHGSGFEGERWKNPAHLTTWLSTPWPVGEHPTAQEAAMDQLIGGLRFVEGVSLGHLRQRTGLEPDPTVVRGLLAGGVVAVAGDRLTLTPVGVPLADGVVQRLVDALIPINENDGPAARILRTPTDRSDA